MSTRWRSMILLGLMSLGLGVRLQGLTARDLWYDEQVTLVDSQSVRPPGVTMAGPFSSTALRAADAGVLSVARQSATHDQPVYVSLIHLWTHLVGVSEVTLRIPSALLGAASVGLLAILGGSLIGETGGLLAALLLAVSPLHVHYSQEARTYALAGFVTLLSMVLLLGLSERAHAFRWMAYGAVAALAPVVHLLSVVALLPHVVVLWPLRRLRRRLALAVLAALAVLCLSLPLGWVQSVRTAHEQSGVALASPPERFQNWAAPSSLPAVLAGLGSSVTRVLGIEYFRFGWRARYLLPLSAPLLGLALFGGWSRPQPQRTLLLGSALLPFVAATALSVHYGHVVTLDVRYSSWSIPFWALLLVDGAMRMRARPVAKVALAVIVLLSAGFMIGGKVVGWPRESVRAGEVRSFVACAPTTEVLRVSDAWQAEVVTALATREMTLALGTPTRPGAVDPTFFMSNSGICRDLRARSCESAVPVCAGL